jgi:hypothetical protein
VSAFLTVTLTVLLRFLTSRPVEESANVLSGVGAVLRAGRSKVRVAQSPTLPSESTAATRQ